MLDCHAETNPGVTEIGRLPLTVQLPAACEADFDRGGLAPSLRGCRRRFPRLRCRNKNNIAALQYRQTLPGLPRESGWFAVYLTDIGRGGMGFLHGEPLYPKEQFPVVFSDGKPRLVEIARCERVDKCCYSIGARFVEQQAAGTEAERACTAAESNRQNEE